MIRFARVPLPALYRLPLPEPPGLLRLLGYDDQSGLVGLDQWKGGEEPRLRIGVVGTLNVDSDTWWTFSRHRAVWPVLSRIPAGDWLLLRPGERGIYHAPRTRARGLIAAAARDFLFGAAFQTFEDPDGSRARRRMELLAWLDGYEAARRDRPRSSSGRRRIGRKE